MRNNLIKNFANVLLIMGIVLPCVQIVAALNPHRPALYGRGGEWYPRDASWTRDVWAGDEKPFQKARKEIEAARDAGEDAIRRSYIRYESLALKNPKNAVLQYAWTYSMHLTKEGFTRADASAPAAALAAVPGPYTYEFARVRFLFESRRFGVFEPVEEFGDLGVRLLAREPRSTGLMIWTNYYLRSSKSEKKRDRALAIARDLVKLRPTDYDTHARLATTYDLRWIKGRNPQDAENAVRAYEEVLRLAPNHPKKNSIANKLIPHLKKELAKANPRKHAPA